MWLVPWLKMPSKPENSLRVRTGLIQSAWIHHQHLMTPDRKYLLWRAGGVAVLVPAAVGTSFTPCVHVKTHVGSDDSAWKKKTSTEEKPHTELPFRPDVSDKTTGSFFSPYQHERGPVTWPEHPPAVLLVRGTLAVVAVALGPVGAGFAVHLEAVFGTLLRSSGAVFGQVALAR